MKKIAWLLMLLLPFAAGCAASKQARSVEFSGFLGKEVYDKLQKGEDGALLVYKNEKVEPRKYSKILIDSIKMYQPENVSEDETNDLKKLGKNFLSYLEEELGSDYAIVSAPEPGTVRYMVAITSAKSSNRVFEVMSLIPPYGIAVSVGKDFITGKPTGVGEISMEIKATDAMTAELLGAAVDRRVGGKSFSGIYDTWDDADAATRYWAKRLRYVNCQGSGRTNCEKP